MDLDGRGGRDAGGVGGGEPIIRKYYVRKKFISMRGKIKYNKKSGRSSIHNEASTHRYIVKSYSLAMARTPHLTVTTAQVKNS